MQGKDVQEGLDECLPKGAATHKKPIGDRKKKKMLNGT
jgi:hypothetical protein